MEHNSFIWWIDIHQFGGKQIKLKYAVISYMQVISKSFSKQTSPLFSAVTFY
jgi:hypothetical protein